jgi:hypothetical protein
MRFHKPPSYGACVFAYGKYGGAKLSYKTIYSFWIIFLLTHCVKLWWLYRWVEPPRKPIPLLAAPRTGAQVRPKVGKRVVFQGIEPPARQAERSGKRGCGGGNLRLPSASSPAVASRLQVINNSIAVQQKR